MHLALRLMNTNLTVSGDRTVSAAERQPNLGRKGGKARRRRLPSSGLSDAGQDSLGWGGRRWADVSHMENKIAVSFAPGDSGEL
jgi:hypothetical protein